MSLFLLWGGKGPTGGKGDKGDQGNPATIRNYEGLLSATNSVLVGPLASNDTVVCYIKDNTQLYWVPLSNNESPYPWVAIAYPSGYVYFTNVTTGWPYKIIVVSPITSSMSGLHNHLTS
jgi:hypothetical protein